MSFNKTQIANLALSKAGGRRITDYDTSNTEEAFAVRACYDSVRQAELRTVAWKFAISRVAIDADATAPDFGRQYRYALPADFLKALPLDPTYAAARNDHLFEGAYILTDQPEPIYLRYVYDVEDTTLFDPLFVQAFACRLAMEVTVELKQSSMDKSEAADQYLKFMADAKRTNAIEIGPVENAEDDWILSRQLGPMGLPALGWWYYG